MLSDTEEMSVIRRYKSRAPVDVVRAIEDLNIRYEERPMSPEQSGYFARRGGRYVIAVNNRDGSQRRRFTAAHELGHYILHRDLLRDGEHFDRLYGVGARDNPNAPFSPIHERQANQFAADFLMPAQLVARYYGLDRDIGMIAERFQVSRAAAEVRLKLLGLM